MQSTIMRNGYLHQQNSIFLDFVIVDGKPPSSISTMGVSLNCNRQTLLLPEHEPHEPWTDVGRPSLVIQGDVSGDFRGFKVKERRQTLQSDRQWM
jgi:hypothetical protein